MAFPLGQLDMAIDRCWRVEEFRLAVRPANLNACEARLDAEAEVKAEITRRAVAGAAAYFIDPETLCRVQRHARSYGIVVRRCADEA